MNIPFIDLKTQYQSLKAEIDQQIQKVLNHGQFILGPEVQEIEYQLSSFAYSKYALTCASGTDAAVMALMALDLKAGDEVIIPSFSFIATAESVILAGGTPVFVDIDPQTYNLDPTKISEALSSKTKAIMPVGLYGQPADMDEINQVAIQNKLVVIEDAAQSFGAKYKDRISGFTSDIGVTSFFPAKPLGCYGDGGAILFSDEAYLTPLKQIRVHGDASRYEHVRIGINGRLDTIQCAILIPKLKRFPFELERRSELAKRYTEAFSALSEKITTPYVKPDRSSSWAQYTLLTDDRAALMEHLKVNNIPTAIHYPKAMPDQPAYQEDRCRLVSASVGRDLSRRVLSLPIFPDMSNEMQDYVIKNVLSFFK